MQRFSIRQLQNLGGHTKIAVADTNKEIDGLVTIEAYQKMTEEVERLLEQLDQKEEKVKTEQKQVAELREALKVTEKRLE